MSADFTVEDMVAGFREMARVIEGRDWTVPVYFDRTRAVYRPYNGIHVVYIVEFSKGLLKVGQTTQLDIRLSGIRSHKNARGQSLTRFWTVMVPDPLAFEARMIGEAHAMGGAAVGPRGREWFTGVNFDLMRQSAESWLPVRAAA